MPSQPTANIDVIIPARNEQSSIAEVIAAVPRRWVRSIIVADNGSTDATAAQARGAGAQVIYEPQRGYGAACLAALASLPEDCDIVVFLDGDGSDDAAWLPDLVEPILDDRADLVIGSRVLGNAAPGSLSRGQRLGNAIAAAWLRHRFSQLATDLGPFRAIRRTALERLQLNDRSYGWTVQMQIEAARAGLRYAEIPVPYRTRRSGQSKVSGTFRGVIGASTKILGLLAYHDWVVRWQQTRFR